jgi:hypothetical protein
MDINKIIDRTKLFLNAKSDNELSQKLGKFPSYIAQLRKRDIDLDLLLAHCPDVELNWLITGDDCQKKYIAMLDHKGNRTEVPVEIILSVDPVDQPGSPGTVKVEPDTVDEIAEYQLREKRE